MLRGLGEGTQDGGWRQPGSGLGASFSPLFPLVLSPPPVPADVYHTLLGSKSHWNV